MCGARGVRLRAKILARWPSAVGDLAERCAWRRFGDEGLRQESAGGINLKAGGFQMATIRQEDFIQSVADALQYISYYHPVDYITSLGRAYEREESAAAKDAMAQILINRGCARRGTGRFARTRGS